MRTIIRDQATSKFIEGPVQSADAQSNYEERSDEKTDLARGYGLQKDEPAYIYDTESPFYAANERYD